MTHTHPQTTHPNAYSRVVVSIGGIDPSGGAGLFADQRAVEFAGARFCGICSTITIQNGLQFQKNIPQPATDVRMALQLIQSNHDVRAVKTGALGSVENLDVICDFAKTNPEIPVVVDPVLKSTTGGALFSADAAAAIHSKLLKTAALITPNLEEASILCNRDICTPHDMTAAAEQLLSLGANAVLIKGGHLDGDTVIDILATRNHSSHLLTSSRLLVGEVRGTGCALASLIAAHIALGETIENGVEKARLQLQDAMRHSISTESGPNILTFASR
ncbi:MAG: hydroxymethylpyrimidine/phosphomethylpyrimidine kinase [Deltaproteobacteria bacterium]|nr:hydroxymethylpyrimidine/phosphomethylpyrimidine kinase [Deltaproteobacteria bacterium]MBN2672860.1 hydroxymethylpyrimidine/phosphomethylpyrimidine kinase [Deltaproteobacteria bacterium]